MIYTTEEYGGRIQSIIDGDGKELLSFRIREINDRTGEAVIARSTDKGLVDVVNNEVVTVRVRFTPPIKVTVKE